MTSAEAFDDYQKARHRRGNTRRWCVGGSVRRCGAHPVIYPGGRQIVRAERWSPLQQEVREMREKMRAHLGINTANDLISRLTMVELPISNSLPNICVARRQKTDLTRWSDNVRILELLAQNDIMEEQKRWH
ncbi:hypothetical protein ACLK1S_18895 [Escherichia coli]